MKRKFGFSLAEALITLLIISLIVVLSAPVITKKARKREDKNMWTFIKNENTYITPTNNNDIMLGSTKKAKGIIVNGVLVFKNKNGDTIGWIAEDGSNSFAMTNQGMSLGSLSDEDMKKLTELVQNNIDVKKLMDSVENAETVKKSSEAVSDNKYMKNYNTETIKSDVNIDIGTLMKTINQINNQQR